LRATAASPRAIAVKKSAGIQYAALPYRVSGGILEILLVTSLRTRRWIIPKGWPMGGRLPSSCAALEALEEAGVSGEIGKTAIGRFQYFKQIKNGVSLPCKVNVFALKVTRERKIWAEKDGRERRWCTVAEAAAAVDEPQLRLLIAKFGVHMAAPRQG
jgi:8-oxo-dGTP pyrophosphatase MutT (NUDIX family)